MGGSCQCCGYNSCTAALAFHHLDPKVKELGISYTRANPTSWERIINELRKCVLVCHNCHSEIHEGIRLLPKTYAKFNEEYNFFPHGFKIVLKTIDKEKSNGSKE